MDTNTVVGLISAAGGAAAAIVAWIAIKQSGKWANAQQRVATHAATEDWRRDLREWASEAIDVLAEASYTCAHHDGSGGGCDEQLRECQHHLSALIDRGRFFLPNQDLAELGIEKPRAYRGRRHAALDPLVAAERVVSGKVGAGSFRNRELALIEMRRHFVSRIQLILAPADHNKEIAQMIRDGNEHRASDVTLGGLLPDKSHPMGAEKLLFGGTKAHSN